MELFELTATPNALAKHYSRFNVSDRLLLSGHSHQAWPDVALDGQIEAFTDAATAVDRKWELAMAKAERVRDGFRALLGDPDGEIGLAASTHELVIKLLSTMDLLRRPRLVTTDGEFHSLRRQLTRLAEEGIEVVRLPAEPVDTLAERLAAAVDPRTSAVLVSAVLFETSRIVPNLGELADACQRAGVELLVDAYHALGVMPLPIHELGLGSAWITGGGYKYLQLGEGNCFLRLPPHGVDLRPVITGWFAEFEAMSDEKDLEKVAYAPGGVRFAGGTYDPTSNYRAARVFDFFVEQGLTSEFLRQVYLHQNEVLTRCFDELGLPDSVITRDRSAPRSAFGGFVALRSRRAGELQQALAQRAVLTDSRADYLRVGPAPYLSDSQLEAAMATLGELVQGLNVDGGGG